MRNFSKSVIVVFLVMFLFVLSIKNSSSIYFASDEIILYEVGVRVIDNSVFHNQSSQLPVCVGGTCTVGQATKPIFYKTTDSNLLNYGDWVDNWYLTNPECRGYLEQEEEINELYGEYMQTDEYRRLFKEMRSSNNVEKNDRLKEEIDMKAVQYIRDRGLTFYGNPDCEVGVSEYENIYLESYINDPQTKRLVVTLPSADLKVTKTCPFNLCFGGRVGTPRIFTLDLSSGELKLVGYKEDIFPVVYREILLVSIIPIGVFVLVLYMILKKRKNKTN